MMTCNDLATAYALLTAPKRICQSPSLCRMALGVVSYTISSHNKMQILQQSTASNTMSHVPERREIVILRKKPRVAAESPCAAPAAAETKSAPAPAPQSAPLQHLAPDAGTMAASLAQHPPLPGAAAAAAQAGRARKRPPGTLHARAHQPPPNAVARRNARERNRVKQVNNGFATLREHIPVAIAASYSSGASGDASARGASRKLSKVETLRMAVDYIRSLQRLLEKDDDGHGSTSNGAFSSDGTGDHRQTQGYRSDDRPNGSPDIVLQDEDDDVSLIDPTSPESVSATVHPYGSALPASAHELQRKAYADASLYEVDENMAPVIVSPSGAYAGDGCTLSPNLLGVAGVPGGAGGPPHLASDDLYGAPPDRALLHRAPPSSVALTPTTYSDASAMGAPDGAGVVTLAGEVLPSQGVLLSAFTGTLKATLGSPHGLPAAYSAHAYHPLQMKREGSPAPGAAPTHKMMDIMAFWERDDRVRHGTTSS